LLNAGAGLTPADPALLRERLGAHRIHLRVIEPPRFQAAIADAVAAGAPVIAVAGGDGSMRAAAAIIAGTQASLACVPTGTLNNFGRRIGVHSLEDAAAALDAGEVRVLPVGTVDQSIFLNTLTFGEYSRIVRMRERFRPRLGKWPAAALAFIITLFTLRRMAVRLEVDAERLTRVTPFVWVGVGWGSFPRVHESLERRRSPDLEVAVLHSPTAAAGLAFVLRLGARMAMGRQPVRDAALDVLHTRYLTLDGHSRVDATADGEVLRLATPVSVAVRDDVLRVVVGPGFRDTGAPRG
jgi:diacylglycerol kinase family enzyme